MKRDDGHYHGCIYGADDGMGDWVNDECYCEEIESEYENKDIWEII